MLLDKRTPELACELAYRAVAVRKAIYGTAVFTRGLIEVSSYCRNDCRYCGLRRSNGGATRYRLTPRQIAECVEEGYALGFRTFVLQGGEDPWFTDERTCAIVADIKRAHPDCAVTLSLGERSRQSYEALHEAGADRYLLRHEAASRSLYEFLHPAAMDYDSRMQCLRDLRDVGYAVGVGFMVGAPGQTIDHLIEDVKFVEEFRPDMCGIGPFIAHHATEFAQHPGGSVDLTCYLLSLLRLIQPNLLLPATTALGTLDPRGRERGIEAGANVVMPNLSPARTRKHYDIYDNKICTGEEAAECRDSLEARILSIGYELIIDRGDPVADE